MNATAQRRLTAALLIIVPLAFTACFTLLQIQFEYPDILRQPTGDILAKFQRGGPALVGSWYAIALIAFLFIPLVVLAHQLIAARRPLGYLWLASTFGVLAGLVQTLGFLRWTFVVPQLAAQYLSPAASGAQREAIAVVFDAFHRYAGMALGEHLGFLATGLWTALIAAALVQSGLIKRWLGWIGAALAAGIMAGLLEPAGWAAAGAINAASYLLWALWLAAVGAALLGRGER